MGVEFKASWVYLGRFAGFIGGVEAGVSECDVPVCVFRWDGGYISRERENFLSMRTGDRIWNSVSVLCSCGISYFGGKAELSLCKGEVYGS